MIKTQTLYHMIQVLEFGASKDETRWHLNSIQINNECIVATDGHKLVTYKHNDEFFKGLKEPIHITATYLAGLKFVLKAAGKLSVIPAIIEKDYIQLPSVQVTLEKLNYPNYKQFTPKDKPQQLKIRFNHEYLTQIAKALKEKGAKDKGITLTVNLSLPKDAKGKVLAEFVLSPLDPIMVDVEGNQAVLMPIRI